MANRYNNNNEINQGPWKKTGISLFPKEFCSDAIAISPSKQFAMIRTFSYEPHINDKILVFDLFNNEINRSLLEPEWKNPAYCYWLSDNLISIFDVNREKEIYVHYFYQCSWQDPTSKLQLLIKMEYQIENKYRADIVDIGNSACKVTINGNDFLFVKSYAFVLVPYNLLECGPSLPLLKLCMAPPLPSWEINGQYSSQIQHAFAFNDKVYFTLRNLEEGSRKDEVYDRFLQVDIDDFNLISRNANYTLDISNATIFFPQKLNEGSYTAYWGEKMAHEGPLIVFCEDAMHLRRTMGQRKLWLLNLEKKTVFEKKIERQPFTVATLYRGFLILWDMQESTMKYHWINNEVPKLVDICHVTLLAQEKHNSEVAELIRRVRQL